MPWFKVDDHFHSNKKVLRIPRGRRCAAVGLWLLVGTWSTSNLTDGVVPDYIVAELGGTPRMVADLVAAGLWLPLHDDEYLYPNWDEYQPVREKVEERRKGERERKQNYRDKVKREGGRFTKSEPHVPTGQERDTAGTHTDVPPMSHDGPTTPDPTRPDPTRPSSKEDVAPLVPRGDSAGSTLAVVGPSGTRGTRLPPNWMPDQDLIAQMRSECPDVDLAHAHRIFTDHWLAQPGQKGVKLDWPATWRNWIRRDSNNGIKVRTVEQRATQQIVTAAMQRAAERDAQREAGS